ncbi:hypothetical protein OEZ85_007622 [Tetradesmus obliquus]|uniref:Uncharacterized protein n=1 Tax=Tetradesmus obliquus TaxID=3088 RepID=A0ABY8TID7_TETOB|nr:hypothetical protein OEZ85_007622 [Tetradesmus obliquus]
MHSLVYGSHWGRAGWGTQPLQRRQRLQCRRRAASGDALSNKGSYLDRVKGFQGPWKAGLTSGTMSAAGDLLAQFLTGQLAKSQGKQPAAYDPTRTLRMFGYGLLWYGPYQYYWYNLLDFFMPVKNTVNFLTKVTLNQLALAPVTLCAVFAWNLGLTGQWHAVPEKIQNDMVPSMINGWKFWVPAASLNFYAVPLQQQVLYMSCCGMLWTAYLSYISTVSVKQQQQQPALAAAGKGGKKK